MTDSDSSTPITFDQTIPHNNRWTFISLLHTEFWFAWTDRKFSLILDAYNPFFQKRE